MSLHAIGETWEERGYYNNTTFCSKCHSGLGYEQFIETGEIIGSEDLEVPLSCNSCHSNHDTFDFENDGPDYALRNVAPTNLDIAPTIALDFGGPSNNCITCHQPRPAEIPSLNPDGTFEITNFRFGPHHSPQSTMLEGILGAEIPGDEVYDAPGTFPHRTGSSCVNCHMGESTDPEVGGHSWNWVAESCTQCHPPLDEATGYQDSIDELIALLLQVEGVDADTGEPIVGIIYYDEEEEGYYATEGIFPDVAAMAVWNYKYAYEDQSKGIHNPSYTMALLKNSIQAVEDLLNEN